MAHELGQQVAEHVALGDQVQLQAVLLTQVIAVVRQAAETNVLNESLARP